MSILKRMVGRLVRLARGPDAQSLLDRVRELEAITDYLQHETSRLSAIQRYLAAPVINDLPYTRQTRASFDYQWDKLPPGRWNLDNAEFRNEAPGYVCQFTGLPSDWFAGKTAIDVGCGAGRYSWAMGEMGAAVLSVDQSEHGLERCATACQAHPNHQPLRLNLLEPLAIERQFDLVWSFGVLHHTGDTYGAYRRLLPLVRPGGYLFMMLYGEPRRGEIGDYQAASEYERWRIATRNMDFDQRLEAIGAAIARNELMVSHPLHVEGYFDAISPLINDLYTFEEIESWLVADGFVDIRRTVETRNHHVVAHLPEDK